MGFFLQKLSNSYSAVDPPFFLYLWQNKIFFTFKIYICQRWNFTYSCILYNNIIYKLCNNILFNILYIQSKAEFVSIVAPGSRVLWSLSSEKILLSQFERISVKLIFVFLWFYLWHMEVPRLGAKSATAKTIATWDLSGICDLHHGSQQWQILNSLSKARYLNHILMDTSQIH